ncbi:SWF or SNF family helicase [Yinghuangia seranimata]|uniref:SWF or SNF family helicase n=1 Tax=Yinghuangia seranimata TaxID=408067 RepID=UPI00248C15A8|nr:SWF or SNF family helicase [Yinghuangia seranimata]MDI2126494.1 SWF or SNF family helicase [Yinghuangia seranimata]
MSQDRHHKRDFGTGQNDAARGFPAFPAGRRGGRAFARSWWGRAWIQAIEDSALELQALKNGRKYAYTGRVGTITVGAGRITATVEGDEDTHHTSLALQPFSATQWDRFVAEVAGRAGHVAALLHRDMPHELASAAADLGAPLLPGLGDLDPACDCDEWGHPCRHAAALAYQAAWLLDEDPFLLLLMRGLGEAAFFAAVQRRGTAATAASAEDTPPARHLTPAHEAYATDPAPLPDPPEVPEAPGEPPALPGVPAAEDAPGVAAAALRLLARDAALRAWELLLGDTASVGLGEHHDAVRFAAVHPGEVDACARLRASAPRRTDFDGAVRAWTYDGPAGLAAFEETWTPAKPEAARAAAALGEWAREADRDLTLQPLRNRWTDEPRGVQLRYGRDARWYPYRREADAWRQAAPSGRTPQEALDAAS